MDENRIGDQLVVVHRPASLHEAAMIQDRLAVNGVEASIVNELFQNVEDGVPLGTRFLPHVAVPKDQEEAAKAVVAAIAEQLREDPNAFALQETDEEAPSFDWPACPECGERRQTVCPVCEMTGDDFPVADYNAHVAVSDAVHATADGCGASVIDDRTAHTTCTTCGTQEMEEVESPANLTDLESPMLLCPTCDEAFEPQYCRVCDGCGHDFGEGLETPPEVVTSESINPRAILVLCILGLGVLAATIYLLWFF